MSKKLPTNPQVKETDGRTLIEHALLNILALAEIDERLDKREAADDLFT